MVYNHDMLESNEGGGREGAKYPSCATSTILFSIWIQLKGF